MIKTSATGVNLDLLRSAPTDRRNPFRPGFGCPPLCLAGRDDVIESFLVALRDGSIPGGASCVITGARGVGKTVLVGRIENICRRCGFDVFSYSSNNRTLDDFLLDIHSRLLGSDTDDLPLDNLIASVCDMSECGVVVIIDEVDCYFADKLIPIVEACRSVLATGRNVCLIMSGLPWLVRDFERLPGASSLLDMRHVRLSSLNQSDSIYAITGACSADGGISIDDELAMSLARISCGYPFAIQLLGSRAWENANRDGRSAISKSDCDLAIFAAYRSIAPHVLDVAFSDMDNIELKITRDAALLAGQSTDGFISVQLLEKQADCSYRYVERLIEDGILTIAENEKHGDVRFAFPYMTEYVANNIDFIDYAISTGKEHPLTDFVGNYQLLFLDDKLST